MLTRNPQGSRSNTARVRLLCPTLKTPSAVEVVCFHHHRSEITTGIGG